MSDKMFVPFSEELLGALGSPLGELVPYRLEYRCVRLLDGSYDFSLDAPANDNPTLQTQARIVHAA